MSGGFGLPSIDFSSLGQLGTTFRDARDRREAQTLLGQQLDATLAVQGQPAQAPLSPLGQQAPAAPVAAARPLSFGSTEGAMGDYLKTARGVESGGNDLAANPNSTAKGRYQFTDGTWKNVAARHPELGLQPGGWRDPAQQERAMQAFTADNAKALTAAGVPINPGNLYVSHFLGESGGPKFIAGAMQNPDAPATSFVSPEAARANRTIFFNRDGSPKTAAQVYAERTGRFGGSAPTQVAQRAASAPVAYASNEAETQALEQRMGMVPPTAQAAAPAPSPQADMPAADAVPAGFQIPGQAPQADFQPGTVASPAIAQPSAPAPASTPLSAAGAQRLNPAQVQNLRAMLANPQTQGYAAKIIEGLNKPDEFSFQVVGDQLVRTSKSGRAEVVPNITKPATLAVTKGADGNDYVFNPQTGQLTRAIAGKDKTYTDLLTPDQRAAAGIQPSYTGPAQRGPDGELRLPGKASTEINLNQAAEKAQDVKIGGAYGDTFNEMQAQGRSASGQINTLRLMEKLIDNPDFYSGAQSGPLLAARRAAVALGIKDAGSAAPNELFAKLATQSVLDKLGGSLGAGVSNSDVLTMQNTVANATNTPEGNRQILQFSKALAQRQIEVAKLAREYARGHGGRLDAGFDDELSAYAQANPLTVQPTAAQQAPTQAQPRAAAAPGAPAVGTVQKGHRYMGGDPASPSSWQRVPEQAGPIL